MGLSVLIEEVMHCSLKVRPVFLPSYCALNSFHLYWKEMKMNQMSVKGNYLSGHLSFPKKHQYTHLSIVKYKQKKKKKVQGKENICLMDRNLFKYSEKFSIIRVTEIVDIQVSSISF